MKQLLMLIAAFSLGICFSVRAVENIHVGENELKGALLREFSEQGESEDLELELFGGKTEFDIPDARQVKIMIADMHKDEASAKFRAGVIIYANGEESAKTELSGKFYRVEEVFVPARNISKGKIIAKEDLRKIKVRKSRIKPQYVVEEEVLVGQEARKSLKEGKMITEKDVGEPLLVRKGDVLTCVYRKPALLITAKCEVLQNGGKGDRIDVMNVKSKKVFSARVLDKDTVEADVQ